MMLILPHDIIDAKMDKVRWKIAEAISYDIVGFVVVILIMLVVISMCLKRISYGITAPIIELYQNIQIIIDKTNRENTKHFEDQQNNQKDEKVSLISKDKKDKMPKALDLIINYNDVNYEINTLYRSFSNLTKTIKVARESFNEGNDNQALLNYHEVAQIYEKMGNQEKLGSCMNNLGCIYTKIA